MDAKLLTAAAAIAGALAVSAGAAQAQPVGTTDVPIVRTPEPPDLRPLPPRFRGCTEGSGRDVRREERLRCPLIGGFAYSDGTWALYNNRAFDPDSYNDWWNDRPDRAFPRWVREQHARGTCDPDRMWWSGSGWHC